MDLIQAIALGIVQGLTEFLPISSTAHLRIVPSLLGWPDPGAAFTASIQLGTLGAIVVYFAKDLWSALRGWVASFRGGEAAREPQARIGWAIVLGTIPIGVFGFLFKDAIEGSLRSLYVIAGSLIGMGVLMLLADQFGKRRREISEVGPRDGLWVGLWEAIALIPGASRSGSTITGALIAGFDREAAARFSFLLSVPAILIAAVFSIAEHRDELLGANLAPMLVANVFSFAFGYLSIAFLIRYLQRHGIRAFVLYRLAIGVLLLYLLWTGILTPMDGVPSG